MDNFRNFHNPEVKFEERKAVLTHKTESTQENSTLCYPMSTVFPISEKMAFK